MGDTEAPTSGATGSGQNAKNAGLSPEELQFVTFVNQYYATHGVMIDRDEAVKDYGFEADEFNDLFSRSLVQAALNERGLISRTLGPNDKAWAKKYSLTPLQLIVADAMLDIHDTRSNKKRLQDHSISTTLYNTWLKDPAFLQYLNDRGELMLKENKHEAMMALVDKVRQGDTKAMSMYYEMTGRFVTSTGGNSNSSVAGQDFKVLLVKILEILNDEIDDYNTAVRISERIQGLIGAQSMANQLMDDEPITVPRIQKLGELPKTGSEG